MTRVVITGIGTATPAGLTNQDFWQALTEKRSCIDLVSLFDVSAFRCKLAAELKSLDGNTFPGRKSLWKISRSIAFAFSAACSALEDAGLEAIPGKHPEMGVALGTTLGGLTPLLQLDRQALDEGPRAADPMLFPSAGASAPSCQISVTLGMQAFNTTLSNGQTSGLDAIQYAAQFIRLGRAETVLAGAVEEISQDTFRACFNGRLLAGSRCGSSEKVAQDGHAEAAGGDEFLVSFGSTARALCASEESIEAMLPFDARRSGFLLGEGAAVFVLESLEHALRRNAHIWAELTGYGFSFAPSQETRLNAAITAMGNALGKARLPHSAIGGVFANANGSIGGDRLEGRALNSALPGCPATSIKAVVGESYSAAGAIQSAAALMALRHQVLPGTVGFDQPDGKYWPVPVVKETSQTKLSSVLVNAFGRTGNYASVVFSKYVN
jgi:3-oxoacyl-[acyl-carrier-protein] synthase II